MFALSDAHVAQLLNVDEAIVDDGDQPISQQLAEEFWRELSRLLALQREHQRDLVEVKRRRDAMRDEAENLDSECRDLEDEQDKILAFLARSAQRARDLKAANDHDGLKKLRATMLAKNAAGQLLDGKIAELKDRYFALMALESEVSSYYSVLKNSEPRS